MQEPFVTYKVFNDPEIAKAFASILDEHQVPFRIEEDAYNFDPSYANHPLNKDYRIKIRQKDFPKANEAFAEHFKATLDSVEKDYYLYEFTDEELLDILLKPDEWGELDYQLAQKILNERGRIYSPEQLGDFKMQRIEQLRKPEKTEYTSIIIGYLFAIFLAPVGIGLGYMLAYSKKRLPDGTAANAYSDTQRFHGTVIFVLSCGLTVFGLWAAMTKSFF